MLSFFDDPDDMAEENAPESPPTPTFWRILGKIIKYSFWAIIIFINGMIFWRMCFSSNTPSAVKNVDGDAKLMAAYNEALRSEEGLKGFAIYQPKHDTITNDTIPNPLDPEKVITNYGYFSLLNTVYFPTAHEVQTVLRYNNSTLAALKEDYELDFDPDKDVNWFDVTLKIVVDLTPDDDSDNDDVDTMQLVRLKPVRVIEDESTLYTYRRYVFDDLPAMENIVSMYFDVYYVDDVEYDEVPYGSLCIYLDDADVKNKDYKLSRKDLASIKSGGAS